MRKAATIFSFLVVAASCSPVVRSTDLGPRYAPRPADSQVLTYSVRTPECAFEEIALVTVEREPPLNFVAVEQPLAATEVRARRLGGDAIIGLTQLPPSEGFLGGLSGTVVRFSDADCRE